MARSFISQVAKDSLRPTGQQFAEFTEESLANPISLARNRQEQLNYNVAQNLQQADQGLISPDKASVMAKSYFDAKQAPDMQTADLVDAYNRNRLEGSLQEEATLKRAGINPNRSVTSKRVDPKTGDVYGTTFTTGAKQTRKDDKGLGDTPTEYYGLETTAGPEQLLKRAVRPKKSSGGKYYKPEYRGRVQGATGPSYADEMDGALDTVIKADRLFNDDRNIASGAKSLISQSFASDEKKIQALVDTYNMDAEKAKKLVSTYNAIDAQYVPTNAMTQNGTRELRLKPTPENKFLLNYTNVDGKEYTLGSLDGYITTDGKEFFELEDKDGTIIPVPVGYINKHEDEILNTFRKHKYHLSTKSSMEMVEGDVKRAPKGKQFIADSQPTDALTTMRLAQRNNPELIKAQDLDKKTYNNAYVDAAETLNKDVPWYKGNLSTEESGNDTEEHNKVLGVMAKQLKSKGVQFTIDKSKDKYELDVVDKEIPLLRGKMRDAERPTMIKNKAANVEAGNKLALTATLPSGETSRNVAMVYPDPTTGDLKVSFDNGVTGYDVPYGTNPKEMDELVERFYTEEIYKLTGEEPIKMFSKQEVRR